MTPLSSNEVADAPAEQAAKRVEPRADNRGSSLVIPAKNYRGRAFFCCIRKVHLTSYVMKGPPGGMRTARKGIRLCICAGRVVNEMKRKGEYYDNYIERRNKERIQGSKICV